MSQAETSKIITTKKEVTTTSEVQSGGNPEDRSGVGSVNQALARHEVEQKFGTKSQKPYNVYQSSTQKVSASGIAPEIRLNASRDVQGLVDKIFEPLK